MRVEEILNKKSREKVYKKYKWFPSRLISEDEDRVNNMLHFVIGTGGDGKTLNEMVEAIKLFQSGVFENQSAFFFPVKEDIDEIMKTKDLFDKVLAAEEYKELYEEFINKLVYKNEMITYEGKIFVKFYSINQAHKYKPKDHTRIGNIWFDEFQREKYLPREGWKVMDLLSTIIRSKKGVRIVFTANSVSLNSPLFIAMGFFEIDKDNIITLIKPVFIDKVMAKLWYWKRPEEMLEERYEGDNAVILLSKTSGYYNYRYLNEFNDDMHNIIKFTDEAMEKFEEKYTFKLYDIHITMYMISNIHTVDGKTRYYMALEKEWKEKEIRFCIHQDFAEDGVIFAKKIAEGLSINAFQKDILLYENVVVKQYLWEILKKFGVR